MKHLTDQDLNGYIHQTLTDAQRETMDQHLDGCPPCRVRLDAAKQVHRDIYYGLHDELRQQRPSRDLNFAAIKPGLNKTRRRATVQFHSLRLLANAGIAAVVLLFGVFAYSLLQTDTLLGSLVGEPLQPLFPENDWDDPTPYQAHLLPGAQGILAELENSTVYHIDVTISPNLRRVMGQQQVRYVNQTGDTLDDVVFRLPANLSDSQLSVSGVIVNGLRAETSLSDDISTLTVTLPRRLRPGQTAVIQMKFALDVGRTRQTFNGTLSLMDGVLALSHFQPTLAPYANGAWVLAQPSHNLTILSDNAYYLVRVTVPARVTLVASGTPISRELTDSSSGSQQVATQQVVTLAAGPISQFALVASEKFTAVVTESVTTQDVVTQDVVTETVDADLAAESVKVVSESVGNTRINVYAEADYLLPSAQDALADAVATMRQFNARFGPYPFTKLDIINLPNMGFSLTAQSYPGIGFVRLNPPYRGDSAVTSAATLVTAEQWFGRMAGYRALAEPWLAQSFTEYALYDYVAANDGDAATAMAAYWAESSQMALPVATAAAELDEADYARVVYGRGPLALQSLAAEMGVDTAVFDAFLRDYYQQQQWHPPTTADFLAQASATCGCNLTTFAETWVYPDR